MKLYDKPTSIELLDNELLVNGKKHLKNIRLLSKMQEVLLESTSMKNIPIYYMYRSIYKHKTLRYDITYIPANFLGKEYAKTYGHYHPKANGLEYPEVYQVLSGNAMFSLQKNNPDDSVDVFLVNAKEKETVIFPPGYGHSSINPTNKDLILANLVSNSFENDYNKFKSCHGGAYYYTKNGTVKNKNYTISNFEQLNSKDLNSKFNFSCKDLLNEFYNDPQKFEFLEKPTLLFKF